MVETERDEEAGQVHLSTSRKCFAFVLAEQGIKPGQKVWGLCLLINALRGLTRGADTAWFAGAVFDGHTRICVQPEASLIWLWACPVTALCCFLLLSSSSKGGDTEASPKSDVLRHQKWKVHLSHVIACLRGESICTANGHLHNPVSFHWLISTVGLPQGAGGEELGNINRKMTSSKRAPFSTYCWLASWFRADKQIWPGSCCSVWGWHQQSRIGNISRGGRCGCDPCPQSCLQELLSVAET